MGREYITGADDDEKYLGVDLVVTRANNCGALKHAAEKLDISSSVFDLGTSSLSRFGSRMIYDGRASVDVLVGTTDSGRPVEAAVDVTPRVGNNTPAEIEAKAALKADPAATFAGASVRLYYDPEGKMISASATRYVNTASLVLIYLTNQLAHRLLVRR